MQNPTATLMSQYANSPAITGIVAAMNQWIDPTADIDAFYDFVWNVQTAQGFGLDIWGRIVNVSRNLKIAPSALYFGYDEANTGTPTATDAQPFGQSPMWNGPPASTTYALSDDAYRQLIMVKAMANITDCTAPSINALLHLLFGTEGRCFVADNGSMSIRYVFEFNLSPVALSIMLYSGVVPRPAGVLMQVMQLDIATTFGFSEGGMQPFGQGIFFPTSGIQNAIY